MTRKPLTRPLPEKVRLLLLGVWQDEREELRRALAPAATGGEAGSRFLFLTAATFAEAVPMLRARTADVLVCDLDVYLFLRRSAEEPVLEPSAVPTLVLVSPGEERRAAALLEDESAEFLLRAGNYRRLLPAWVRRAVRRRDLYWEEVAALLRHEINNPLTGVLGNAELLLAETSNLPEKGHRRLQTIIELAVRLRDVVRHLEARLASEKGAANGAPEEDCSTERLARLPREVTR